MAKSPAIVIETMNHFDNVIGIRFIPFCHRKQEKLSRLEMINESQKPKLQQMPSIIFLFCYKMGQAERGLVCPDNNY